MDNMKLYLGPMAGFTDRAFREICKDLGCDIVVTEMVSSKGLIYKNYKTKDLLKYSEKEKPILVQIFGSEPDIMAESVKMINEEFDFYGIDINMGCPVKKITLNGEGSALMQDPIKAGKIIEAIKKVTNKPVSAKIRSGFKEKNAPEFAYALQESGADLVTVHGRTKSQMYEGKADYDIIARVVQKLSIPVIANGDIYDIKSFCKIREITGAAGYMIARGALRNPYIFRQIKKFLSTGNIPDEITTEEKIEIALKHIELVSKYKPGIDGMREIRKHLHYYTKGIPRASIFRNKINIIDKKEEMISLLKALYLEEINGKCKSDDSRGL